MVDIAAIDQDLDGIADYVMVSLGNGKYPPSASRQTVFYLGGKTGVINTSIPLSNGGTFTLPQSGKSYVTRPIVPDVDMDGDGVKSDQDCEDSDPTVYPGATEICDGKDNNCNYSVDESLQCPLP